MTGDVRAPSFDEAFPALAATGYRVAYRLLGDRSEAEDVAQEAVARAYARWRHVQPHAEPWVARVASNLALDALRRRGRRGTASIDASSSAEPSLADRSEADTALALGTSVGSVKRHAHRGLAALRTAWIGLEPEPLLDPGGA
jgi:DNA-directed RNA polymerase specialized sigma24 family protein